MSAPETTSKTLRQSPLTDALGLPLEGPEKPAPAVLTLPMQYTVSVFPLDDPRHNRYACKVIRSTDVGERHPGDNFYIVRLGSYLAADGWWERPTPQVLEDPGLTVEWIENHSFPREQALRMARKAAPYIEYKGITALQAKDATC